MNHRLQKIDLATLRTAHKGLLLDKFMPVKSSDAKKEEQSFFEPLSRIARVDSAHPAYRLAFERWRAYAAGLPEAVRILGAVRGRMAIGLGAKGTSEIGCRLHHSYGVPMIPGSSLKGALRAALEHAPPSKSGVDWQQQADFLFGNQDSAGFARVFDAWWVPDPGKSGLSVDVVTGHHQDYNSGKPGSAPTDFDSPIPNHYLTVTGKFLFVVQAPNQSWSQFLEKLLKQTLDTNGIGSKKSSGYGRFHQWS